MRTRRGRARARKVSMLVFETSSSASTHREVARRLFDGVEVEFGAVAGRRRRDESGVGGDEAGAFARARGDVGRTGGVRRRERAWGGVDEGAREVRNRIRRGAWAMARDDAGNVNPCKRDRRLASPSSPR